MVQTHEQLNTAAYYIGRNVDLGPGVVIAAGAVLEAAPESQLKIEAGVCIGTGAVIQVYGGNLTIAAGANIGQEVLLVGAGQIGERACIGAESTVIHPCIEADAVIPAKSLIRDRGQVLTPPPSTASSNGQVETATDHKASTSGPPGNAETTQADTQPSPSSETKSDNHHHNNGHGQAETPDATDGTMTAANFVYGRDQVMQLVKTLFPHRDMLNNADDNTS